MWWTRKLCILLISVAIFCINSTWGIQILAKTREPACNPIPVDGELVVLKVVTDMSWDNCFWYHSHSGNNVFNENEIVCKQFHTDTGLTHPCLNVTSIRSTSLSGGAVAENKTCELHISNLDASDTGFWNVDVSLNGANDQDFFELEPMAAANITLKQTTNATNENGISFVCSANGGVPKANKFEWRIDGSTTFYEDWQAILYPLQDDVADNVVKQMLNLAPPSDGSYDVECISYQTFQDATITQGANVTFEVNSSTKDDKKLSTGAIIAIVVPCALILILIIIVIIACLCGCCCFKPREEKAKDKAKGRDVPDQQRQQQPKANAQRPIPLNQQNIEIRPDVVTTNNQRYQYEPRRDYGYYNNDGYQQGYQFSTRSAPNPPARRKSIASEDDGVLV